MVHHRLKKHDCTIHTADVVERTGLLVPCIAEEEVGPVRPAELADWISVEAEDEPEIAKHGWLVELDDETHTFSAPPLRQRVRPNLQGAMQGDGFPMPPSATSNCSAPGWCGVAGELPSSSRVALLPHRAGEVPAHTPCYSGSTSSPGAAEDQWTGCPKGRAGKSEADGRRTEVTHLVDVLRRASRISVSSAIWGSSAASSLTSWLMPSLRLRRSIMWFIGTIMTK